jgi:hypothetical protein
MLTQQLPRPICINCRNALAKPNGKSKNGFTKWHKYCADCAKGIYSPKYRHLLEKKSKCDKCGFIAEDRCQLDLIYKDNNKKNTSKKNLITLCANCSRVYKKKSKANKKSILNLTVDADVRIS